MPKHDRSMLTDVAAGVRGRIDNLMDYYQKNPSQRFGVEKVTKDEARRRFLGMSPEDRQGLIAQQGIQGVLNLFRKRGKRP